MGSGEELWTTTEVAKYLGVQPGTVSAYRHRGQMPPPAQTRGERTHLWSAATIREWQARRTGKAAAPPLVDSPKRVDPHEWLNHGERDLYVSEWVRLSLVDVEPPEGSRFEHHVVTMKPAAMTAILNEEGTRVGLVWRHRFAPGVWNWELPGGLVDGEEDPAETAKREIREELGLDVHGLRHLVSFEPNVGMVRNTHYVYAARGYTRVADPTEVNEGAGLEWVELSTVQERIDAGEIANSGTLVALLYLLAFGIE